MGHLSGSNFVVLRRPRALDLPVAFRNASFTAYRLPAQFGATSVVIADMGQDGVRVRWATADGRAPVQLFVEFREPGGTKSLASSCCITLDRPSGDVVVPLPPRLPAGRYHPAIGIRDIATGAELTAVADRAGAPAHRGNTSMSSRVPRAAVSRQVRASIEGFSAEAADRSRSGAVDKACGAGDDERHDHGQREPDQQQPH